MLKDTHMMKPKLNLNTVRLPITIVALATIYFIYMVAGYGHS